MGATAPVSSFPRYLRRPAFRGVSPAAIAAIEPDLTNVSVEFIQQKIHDMGNDLFFAIENTEVSCPKGRLPRELEAIINDVSTTSPTHIIATYSQPNALQKQRISIHPVHALVLATNCANLPPLPYSKPDTPKYPGGTISLPVIPLAIHNPATFPILLEYLYTQRTDSLLRSLLPLSPCQSIPKPEDLAKHLGATCSSMTLRTHLQRIHGFWTNVAALGVFDEKLWRTMEAAWEVLHGALACP
ncbi:hypothetical protein BU17DRAFT_43567 [Hysterangium stoloniferum]|nr:hypothetical protein BU17DRAFT_43567 [Hysterangium stoloniferum]